MRLNHQPKRVVGNIRQTQLITTFGCGSIVDLPHDSVIVAGTDYWKHYTNEDYMIHEVNLQKLLKVNFFVKPKDEEPSNLPFVLSRDIPAFRFPENMVCAKCGKISHYKLLKSGKSFKCRNCGHKKILPSRFVVACKSGHLDDFPYSWWVHRGDISGCSNPDNNLFMKFYSESGGLESIVIECRACNGKKEGTHLSRNMKGSFSENALAGWNDNSCTRKRPWLKDQDPLTCTHGMRTTQRGASNLYFPNHVSALSIPPWSSRIQNLLSEKRSFLEMMNNLNPDDNLFNNILNVSVEALNIHKECNCTIEDVKDQVLLRINKKNSNRELNEHTLLEDEYRAFLEGNKEDKDFIIREGDVPEFLNSHIDSIVLAHKLREVVALTGFNRIKPNEAKDTYDINIRKQYVNWLPGIEMYGEGIFIRINESKLLEWESKYEQRFSSIMLNSTDSIIQTGKLSSRFILLHTLAHLMIRQLVLQCGYSSSSIKEKIYSTFYEDENPLNMAGILVYTTTPDSEGSLGGLVNQGRQNLFAETFKKMIEAASWCSSDPLCITSSGQGLDSLNLAACHSCTLLPETSCEIRNSFLDRAAVIGTLENRKTGFFGDLTGIEEYV